MKSFLFLITLVFSSMAFAQDMPAAVSSMFDLSGILAELALKFPLLMQVATVMGALRLVMKPLMAVAQSVVDYTPYDKDNLALAKVQSGKVWKSICMLVDWLSSVKLPK